MNKIKFNYFNKLLENLSFHLPFLLFNILKINLLIEIIQIVD
ncbi:hypothetical protein HMPREF0216_02036 [Clostridium celatum DSM 1785]|uniref:Uncharacterized protein n=1 Tax=Clostridium celatum DSM 1785 TaxID=545697 RepID=L1QE36_9CLOT|nr:hypothetical protein HMPREF0216_02036 [Clostridium celatum DSM 1785]